MKIKIVLLLLTVLAISEISYSQIMIKAKLIDPGVASCDISIVASTLNKPAGATIYRLDSNLQSTQSYENDTISDFCNDMNDQMIIVFGNDTLAQSTFITPSTNYQITNYIEPSSYVSQDGSITITFDSIQILNLGLILAQPQYDYYPSAVSSDNKTFIINNLRYGKLIIMNSNMDPNFFASTIFIGNPVNLLNNNTLNFTTSVSDAYQDCNGSIHLTPINAIGNVSYQWSNDSLADASFQENLCPGIYSIYAIDDNQNQSLIQVFVTDSAYNYYDPSLLDYLASDTANFNFMNCQLNYNLPLDSIAYSEDLISQNGDTAIYIFDLILYQNGDSFLLSDTLIVMNDSNLYLSSVVFCQELKSAAFSGIRVSLIRPSQQLVSNNGIVKDEYLFSISPNPTENSFKINSQNSIKGTLLDVNGQAVKIINSSEVSISELKSGVYFLKMENSSKVVKVIKK